MDDRHLGALHSVYLVLVFSALGFLCKDAAIWALYAFQIPFGPWQILFGLLSGLNLLALSLPFVFDSKLRARYGNHSMQLAVTAVIFLWFSNFLVTMLLWGAFCDFCYFG
jgi:hypothetical protein